MPPPPQLRRGAGVGRRGVEAEASGRGFALASRPRAVWVGWEGEPDGKILE